MSAPFEITLQAEAVTNFEGLDPEIRRRVRKKLIWLAEHADDVRHVGLSDDLVGLFKLRIGDYRCLYELSSDDRRIVVHRIGHRSEIYERR